MLTAKSALPLALLASSAVASGFGHNGHQHQSRHSRAVRARRGAADPATISTGSLTAAEGCTAWYNVKSGDSCYSAIATVEGGLSLEDFYAMNPQVDGDCFNLWTGYDYCVSRTTTSSSKPETTKKVAVVAENHVEKVLTTTTAQAKVVATRKPEPATTTTTEAAPTPTPEAREPEEVDDEEDCDAEDGEEEEEQVATTTAAPVRAAVQATTEAAAPAPTTTKDDAEAQKASVAAARSKASADAAWAASSSSSAAAAAAASSKSSADAAWQRQQAVKTTSAAAAAQTTTPVFNGGNVNSKLAALGITTFLGEQTGAIGSWFRTNSAQDSTNGNSWCYRPYDDSMPGFAPSLKTMLASFGGDPIAAGKAFCGQEAEFTTPDGRTATLFIADAFDDRWVLTPTSVDIVKGAFAQLFGSDTDNKNDVIQNLSWRLTGNKNPSYTFNNGNPV